MKSNIDSTWRPTGLGPLAAMDTLAAQDLDGLPAAVAAERVLVLRGLLERLEGQWLRELAAVDARGAAGAEDGTQAPSTAAWLRNRARLGAPDAHQRVRVARALHRGPLGATAQALAAGDISATHAAVLARGTQDLPGRTAAEAEPVLLEAARRLDPSRLRQVVAHLCDVADPEAADAPTQRQHGRRGLWVSATLAGMVAVDGLLDPEAGETLLAALDPLARPTTADDERSGSQRRADALHELARRALEGGRLPQTGGVRPQVTVTVELASLLGRAGTPGGDGGCGTAARRDGPAAGLRRRAHPRGGRRRWRSATAAAGSPAATGHRPGATPTTFATGCTAAPPTWPTWRCCAAPTTAPSTKADGGSTANPTGTSPPHPRTEDSPPRREAVPGWWQPTERRSRVTPSVPLWAPTQRSGYRIILSTP